jgi:uncharacterized protein YecE (DUF72 family)
MKTGHGHVRIGISGWRYAGWRGVFYPPKLAHRRELEFASLQFNTIELNGSFYSLQRPDGFRTWSVETPEGFLFAVKGSRYITHMRRLREIDVALANFFAQGLLCLGDKLGPILWQFPPNFQFEHERLERFLTILPRSHKQAARLASNHDRWMNQRVWFDVDKDVPLRHAIEIRHESFVCEEFIQLLRRQQIGLVVADTVDWPLLMDVTADFVYCRLHGSQELYASGYDEESLTIWAKRVAAWAQGDEVEDGRHASQTAAPKHSRRDVYVYIDNDAKVRAPFDARDLRKRVDSLLGRAAGAAS